MKTLETIAQLIYRCRQQDQKAQMEVYQLYYKAMYNTALRMIKDPMEAEDAMQESFLKAFQQIHSFEQQATFGAWLKRIVVNQCLTVLKKQHHLADLDEETVVLADIDDSFMEDAKASKVKLLLHCMNLMKHHDQLLLNLHYLEGYDLEEICEILNISYASCRTQMSRARQRLKRKMEAHE